MRQNCKDEAAHQPAGGVGSGGVDDGSDPGGEGAARKRGGLKRLLFTLAVLLAFGCVTALFVHDRERQALRASAAKVELGDSRAQVERVLGEPAMEMPPLESERSSSAMYGTSVDHVHLHVGVWIIIRIGYSTYWSWLVPGMSDWPVMIKYDQNSDRVTQIRRFGDKISSQGN